MQLGFKKKKNLRLHSTYSLDACTSEYAYILETALAFTLFTYIYLCRLDDYVIKDVNVLVYKCDLQGISNKAFKLISFY
jgi:hypothetical protein